MGFAPYAIAAVQELNIQISSTIPQNLDASAYAKIQEFLRALAVEGKITIQSIFAETIHARKIRTDELCIGPENVQTCLTQTQINQILQNLQPSTTNTADATQETPQDEVVVPNVLPLEPLQDEPTVPNTALEE
jgi:hypothetical protein